MTDQQALTRNDIKMFGKKVQDLLLHIANDWGIRYRIQDGNHLLFYPADGSRPRKVSASKQDEHLIGYLTTWATEHCAAEQAAWLESETARREKSKTEVFRGETPAVAAALQDAVAKKGPIQVEVEAALTPTKPAVVAPEPAREAETHPCDECDKTFPTPNSLMAHKNNTHRAEASKINGVSRAKRTFALKTLAEALDVEIGDAKTLKALRKEITDLTKANAALQKQVDDFQEMKAKFDLLREALG